MVRLGRDDAIASSSPIWAESVITIRFAALLSPPTAEEFDAMNDPRPRRSNRGSCVPGRRRCANSMLAIGACLIALAGFAGTASAAGEQTASAATTQTSTTPAPTPTTKTVTEPGKTTTVTTPTTTVTAPTQTNTVIKTETTTVPTTTTTTTSNAPAAALAGAAAAASNEESSEEGGLPGWAWALIGAAAAGGLIWAVLAFRRRGKDGAAKGDGDGEKATGGAPPGVGGPPPA